MEEGRVSDEEASRRTRERQRFRKTILLKDRPWTKIIFLCLSIVLSATATLVGSANAGDFAQKMTSAMLGGAASSGSASTAHETNTEPKGSKAVSDLFWTLSYATFFLSGTKLNYITFFLIYWLMPNTRPTYGTVLKTLLWFILTAVCTLPNIFFSVDASDRYEEVRRAMAAKIGGPIQSFLFNIFNCSLILFFFTKYILKRESDEDKQINRIKETLITETALVFDQRLTSPAAEQLAVGKFHVRYRENQSEKAEIAFAIIIATLSFPYIGTHLAATINGLIDFFKKRFAASTTDAQAGASILGGLSTLMIACFSLYASYHQSKKLYRYLYGIPILPQEKNVCNQWLTCIILFTCFICTSSSANLVHEYLFVEWAGHDETDLGILFAAWVIAFFGTWLGYSLFSIEAAHELPYLFKPAPLEILIRKITQMPAEQVRATAMKLGLSIPNETAPLLLGTALLERVDERRLL